VWQTAGVWRGDVHGRGARNKGLWMFMGKEPAPSGHRGPVRLQPREVSPLALADGRNDEQVPCGFLQGHVLLRW
jgi:hypothetical protein